MMFEKLSTKTFRSFAALLLAAVFILCILPPSTAAAVASGVWSLITNPSTTYSRIYDMCGGKYFIVSDSNGLYGLMNANLEYVVNPQYSNIEVYSDFILVCKNSLWGILDGNGNTVVAPTYDSLNTSINKSIDDGILIYSLNGRQGLIRTDGTVLTNAEYSNINHLCNNAFTHRYASNLKILIIGSNTTDNDIYQSIDHQGDGYLFACLVGSEKPTIIINSFGEKHTVPEGYHVQQYLGDNRFLISNVEDSISYSSWSWPNRSGSPFQAVILHWDGSSVQLSTATSLSVNKDDGYIIKRNTDGKYTVVFRDGTEFSQTYAYLRHMGKGHFIYQDALTDLYGIVNADGTKVVAAKYGSAPTIGSLNQSGERFYTVSYNGKEGIISWQGEIAPCIYDEVNSSSGSVRIGSEYGAYDLSTTPASLVVPVSYRSVISSGDGFYSFRDGNGRYGIIKDGQVIKTPKYDSVYYCGNNGFILSLNDRFGAFAYGGSVDTECIYDDIICSYEQKCENCRWHTPRSSQAFFVFPTSIPSGSNNDSGSNGNNDGGNSGGGGGSTNSFGSSPINFFSGSNDGVKMKVLIDGKETEVTLTLNNFTYNYDTPVQVTTISSYNLRKGPDASYGTYKKVRKGAKLTIIGRDRDWLIVDMGGGKPAYILEGMVR